MRKSSVVTTFVAFLLVAFPGLATVNHGDFLGTDVDFRDVSETTTTVGDPEPIWESPSLSGDGNQLSFAPSAFLSSCASGTSDTTASDLTTTLEAHGGVHIELVALQEAGDATLTAFPPFGTPATNASAAVSGTVTVTEDIGGPIAPVVIPFSGTFTPSSSFALPTNFGTSTWTGNILVDVAAVVPNATKAELALTNTLDTNCAPGTASATIQKKSVTGPAVSLLVNPLECELELEKTCCVTQPVLPDFDACGEDDDLVSVTFEYTGDKCHNSTNDQGHAFKCYGSRKLGEPSDVDILKYSSYLTATPDSNIDIGEEFTVTSSTGTLFNKLKLKVSGSHWRRQYLKIDSSCDRAIQCGDKFGALTVTGLETVQNGVIDCNAPPPPPECAVDGSPPGTPCDAKIVDMVLEYNGQDCQEPLGNPQNGEAECEGDATGATDVGIVYTGHLPWTQTISPASGINDGDRIRVTATWWGGLFPNQKYKIVDAGGVRQKVEFHTSCSQPLALGDEFGSLKLVEFTTKAGTTVALPQGDPPPFDSCEVPLSPPGPHCTSDLKDVTLVYIGDFLGEGCTVSNPQFGFATCTGVADPGDPIAVNVGYGLDATPTDMIEFGDLVTVTADDDDDDLPSVLTLTATGAGGSQQIKFKTSCRKPLSLGDRFGGFVVFGMNREDDGPVSLGGNVQYQYEVTNPNVDTVDNVEISDDQLGVIVSGLSLAPSEMQTFSVNATLFGTTTNVATATGDVNGAVCDPGMDSLTVDVLAPPPGAFFCSEPIDGVTLIWDGAQAVDVRVWSAAPIVSTLLHEFQDIQPGDAIEIEDLILTYPTIEIFHASGAPKLGESSIDPWCLDKHMNGVEDCGKNVGNLRWDDPNLINDWLLEGIVDTDETLACTPGLVPQPPSCGFGPELIVLMPGLLWWHRRKLRKEH